jgi:hypothetical protein
MDQFIRGADKLRIFHRVRRILTPNQPLGNDAARTGLEVNCGTATSEVTSIRPTWSGCLSLPASPTWGSEAAGAVCLSHR